MILRVSSAKNVCDDNPAGLLVVFCFVDILSIQGNMITEEQRTFWQVNIMKELGSFTPSVARDRLPDATRSYLTSSAPFSIFQSSIMQLLYKMECLDIADAPILQAWDGPHFSLS